MNKNLKSHREIGWEQEIFFTHEYAPGAPFWLPKGMIIFKELEKLIRKITEEAGYQEISTPIMVKTKLFVQSGHWAKFGEGGGHDMYNLSVWENEEIKELGEFLDRNKTLNKLADEGKFPFIFTLIFNNHDITVNILGRDKHKGIIFDLPVNFTLKPMNCPEATIVYSSTPRSYRELPLRLAEIGRLHRREQSGELNGLLRVRQLTMDDAHIFVSEDQVLLEVMAILDTLVSFYNSFNFDFEFKLATRPEKFIGEIRDWDKAEKDLETALKERKLKYTIKEKDGAFYGPKIDLHIKDSLGRSWQLGTVQIDFALPSKKHFNLRYIDSDSTEKQVVMIHRAIFGSFERFIGILLEHHQGALPIWLSPVQVVVIPISDKQWSKAKAITEELKYNGIRTEFNSKQGTMQSKIREATLQKVPFMVIIGDKEISKNEISFRERSGKTGRESLSLFIKRVKESIDKKV